MSRHPINDIKKSPRALLLEAVDHDDIVVDHFLQALQDNNYGIFDIPVLEAEIMKMRDEILARINESYVCIEKERWKKITESVDNISNTSKDIGQGLNKAIEILENDDE